MADNESFPGWLAKEAGKGILWLVILFILIIVMTLIGKALYGF